MLMIVGLGSFAGGVLRFLLARFVQVNSASSFPWGTAAVNLLGCFILGFLYGLFNRSLLHTETRLFLTAGLCGGFTTFSTLMNESFLLLKEGNFSAFFLYTVNSVGNEARCFLDAERMRKDHAASGKNGIADGPVAGLLGRYVYTV